MRSLALSVSPAICGDKRVSSRLQSASSEEGGSCSKTSRPTAWTFPELSAFKRAFSQTTPPLDVFAIIIPGFI